MDDTVFASQDGVVGKFQSTACHVFRTKHITYRTLCQRTERVFAGIVLLYIETALERGADGKLLIGALVVERHVEHGQHHDLGQGVISHTRLPHQPVA